MLKFDRIVLIVLAVGVWALVLAPREIGAHHSNASHYCYASGTVDGEVDSDLEFSIDASEFNVRCSHD